MAGRLGVAALALSAQTALDHSAKSAGAATTKPRAAAHPPSKKPVSAPDAGAMSNSAASPSFASSVLARPSPAADAGAGGGEAKTLDGGARVFKFSELDIEGRLKSPQLVYFLRRVRAEFAAGDLGHRSFLREMSETRKESAF